MRPRVAQPEAGGGGGGGGCKGGGRTSDEDADGMEEEGLPCLNRVASRVGGGDAGAGGE